MIGWFPSPYPDELFYSICARFDALATYSSLTASHLEMFGQAKSKVIVDLPCNLRPFTTALPSNNYYTVDRIIDEHSLLNFYSPFLPPERVNRIRREMDSANGKLVHKLLGVIHFSIKSPTHLRYCPDCVVLDRETYGEAYWHRLHQIVAVNVCPTHKVCLVASDIGSGSSNRELFCAERTIHADEDRNQQPEPAHVRDVSVGIARDVSWLLSQRFSGLPLSSLQSGCSAILSDRGFATPGGKIKIRELAESIKMAYPPDLLRSLQSEIHDPSRSTWVDRFIFNLFHHHVSHPLRFLRMARFFGLDAKLFLERCDVKSTGVGKDHDRKRNSTKRYGADWEEALRKMWKDESLFMADIGRELGVGGQTIKAQAVRLGLKFPRIGPHGTVVQLFTSIVNSEKRQVNKQDLMKLYREKWLTAIRNYPLASRTTLQSEIAYSANRWLRTHDKKWLRAHLPPARKRNYSEPRKNWSVADEKISQEVLRVASILKQGEGCPIRVTKAAVARQLRCFNQLDNVYLTKLPLTTKALNAVIESYTAFALRRIRWATHECKQRGESPSIQQFLAHAHLDRALLLKMPEMRPAVSSAIGFLSDPNFKQQDNAAAA